MIGKLFQMVVGGARRGEKYAFREGADKVAVQYDSPITILNTPLSLTSSMKAIT